MLLCESLNLLKSAYTACTRPVCEKFNLTQMEFDILLFLANNAPYDTATDIVRMRKFTKSHVSTALKHLTVQNLLETYYEEGNRKSIHLRLLPAAQPIIHDGQAAQEKYGKLLLNSFSETEIALCQTFFTRMCDNARSFTQEDK